MNFNIPTTYTQYTETKFAILSFVNIRPSGHLLLIQHAGCKAVTHQPIKRRRKLVFGLKNCGLHFFNDISNVEICNQCMIQRHSTFYNIWYWQDKRIFPIFPAIACDVVVLRVFSAKVHELSLQILTRQGVHPWNVCGQTAYRIRPVLILIPRRLVGSSDQSIGDFPLCACTAYRHYLQTKFDVWDIYNIAFNTNSV